MKILLFLLLSSISYAKQIKVAVIDTGLDKTRGEIPLCDHGHKDFTGTSINDTYGHGTNVSHLIHINAKNVNYCQVIIKLWENKDDYGVNLAEAIKYAVELDVDVINISASGEGSIPKEKQIIKSALNKGIIFVVSAGNNSFDLNIRCIFYPACYDPRIIVVGNKSKSSNFGSNIVDFVVDGNKKTAGGYTMSGTSQSTAIVTGKVIKNLKSGRQINGKKEEKATKAALEATYKQTGIEKNVTNFVKDTRRKYINEDVNQFIDNNFWIYVLVVERRFEYKYEF